MFPPASANKIYQARHDQTDQWETDQLLGNLGYKAV
jgi:hypothetical protein